MSKKYEHYYAKIKDIYLELPGFSYFHSPSGRFRDNPKMVGRKRIKKRLYGLLTNSETKTGSYIITGFRGVGKTSLVNQVINQLQPRSVLLSQALGILSSWLVVHLIRLSLDWGTKTVISVMFGMLVFFWLNKIVDMVSSLTNWRYHKKQAKGDKQYRWKMLRVWFQRVWRIIKRTGQKLLAFPIIDRRYYKVSSISKIMYFIIYAFGIELMAIIAFKEWGYEPMINIGFLSCFLVVVIALSFIFRYLVDMLTGNRGKTLREENRSYINTLKQYINHSQKVFVRLSFPQEAINSKDVLKSLVQHMYKEYLNYKGFNLRLSKLLLFTLMVLLVSVLYHASTVEQSVSELKRTSVFHEIFPSQDPRVTDYQRSMIDSMFANNDTPATIQSYKMHLGIKDESLSETGLEIMTYIIGWDFYGYYFYRKVYNLLEPVSSLRIGNGTTLLPRYPDVVFFLILILNFGFFRLVTVLGRPFGLISNRQVRKMLRDLNERCQAEVGLGASRGVNAPGFYGSRVSVLSFRRSKNLNYPLATARDIENDLIRIFDQLDRIPKIFAPPEFTFVLDELDKVDPLNNYPEEESKPGALLESEKIRRKKELISSIMANMKVFFTTAKAKFIFIAGREMYDASLADSSDRESYLGSIFHDIIYVSSLYKDPLDDHSNRGAKSIDITFLTERFVCQQLLPDRADFKRNIIGYAKYLDSILRINQPQKGGILKRFKKTEEISPDQRRILEDQKRKIINVLSVFIHYLAFRSKGSPMNLVKLFEDFAEEFPRKREDIFEDKDKLIVSKDRNPQAFYLTFDFHAQYRISLVAGIFRPLVIEAGIHLKRYSDKILVSTSYLLDHVYKFHEFGFSWRNLELLPEIIDINRAPLLRRYIEDILRFLGDSHVKRIENGFVNFKFHRKVIEEINFLSRSNDTESAIFNFTLDESNRVKSHYRERLDQLIKDYRPASNEVSRYPYSIGFLESVLGDLHFFDKEYDEAIFYYSNAAQSLKERDFSDFTLSETFVYTRTMLKEALVYERMNTLEPALIKYSELSEIIRRNGKRLKDIGDRDLLNRKYGEKLVAAQDRQSETNRLDFHFAKSMYENFSIMLLPLLAKLVAIEKISKQGITLKDSRRADRDFHSVFDYLKKDEKYLLKVEYHLQKGNILFFKNGLLYRDYGVAESTTGNYGHGGRPHRDFNAPYSAYEEYMTGVMMIVKKFNNKYLKSHQIDDKSLSNSRIGQPQEKDEEIENYKEFTELIEKKIVQDKNSFPFEKETIYQLINFLNFEPGHISKLNVTHNTWNLAARLLSALGDCFLTMCDKPSLEVFQDEKSCEHVSQAFNPLHPRVIDALKPTGTLNSRTELAVICFGASAVCYNRANEVRNYAFQQKKIFFTIKSYHRFFKANQSALVAASLQNELGKRIIEPLNKNRRYIIFPEHSKSIEYGVIVNPEDPNVIRQMFSYYKFSYNTETKMAILHWMDLYISDFKNTSFWQDYLTNGTSEGPFRLTRLLPINAYSTVNDQMVRLFELRLKSRYNRKVLLYAFQLDKGKRIDYDEILKPSKDSDNKLYMDHMDQELFEMCYVPEKSRLKPKALIGNKTYSLSPDDLRFLVLDSIFCELRLIESINLNNVTYIKGYHYLAGAYLSLGWWIEVFNEFFIKSDERDIPDETAKTKMLGSKKLRILVNKFLKKKVRPHNAEQTEKDRRAREAAEAKRVEKERKELMDMMGKHEYHYLQDQEYAYRQSLANYYECINVHSEGEAYQAGLANLYFTEGDFNDDNQHFCAAVERWMINHKQVRRRIQFIKIKLEHRSMFYLTNSDTQAKMGGRSKRRKRTVISYFRLKRMRRRMRLSLKYDRAEKRSLPVDSTTPESGE